MMMTIVEKRGDSTRLALIHAALELFGEYGFNGTSTRMIADQAAANISAIPYYFGSKRGLYLAVMEHIVERMQEHMGELRHSVGSLAERDDLTFDEARQAMNTLIHTLSRFFVGTEEPKAWVQLIMREQSRPTEAFDIIYTGQMIHIQRMFTLLIARCTGIQADSDEARLRCHALIGQIMIFILSRESLLRHLGVTELKPDHIQCIYKILVAHTEAALNVVIDTGNESGYI